MNTQIIAAIMVAGLVALGAPSVLRPLLQRSGVVDVPNSRSSHSRVTIRGGGSSTALGIVAGAVTGLVFGSSESAVWTTTVVVAVAGCVATLGFIEDVKGVSIIIRAGSQIAIGFLLVVGLTGLHLAWAAIGAICFAAYVNFANFMDGINGMSSLHGFVAGLVYALLGIAADLEWMVLIGSIVSVSFLAFLPWNLFGSGMFLGDVGSYLLGGALAATVIAATVEGISPLVTLSPLIIYLGDTISTLINRSRNGQPLFKAHRSHIYQRLTSLGYSHMSTSIYVAILSAISGMVGVLAFLNIVTTPIALIAYSVVVLVYLLTPRMLGEETTPKIGMTEIGLEPLPDIRENSAWEPRTWAVLGASGFIGSAVKQSIEAAGMQVKPIQGPRLQIDLGSSATKEEVLLRADDESISLLARELADCDVVVNAAGLATPDGAPEKDLYGANALLPAVVFRAAEVAGVRRVVHLSSAAVQGHRRLLTAKPEVSPFSGYSHSKAMGESVLAEYARSSREDSAEIDVAIIRATSVQGPGRKTTASLQRIARSPLSSVSGDGSSPSVVSSLSGLTQFVVAVGTSPQAMPGLLLQPWEGLSAFDVLALAGGKPPRKLPDWLCATVLGTAGMIGRVVPDVIGPLRRLEMMWLGQSQETPESTVPAVSNGDIRQVLSTRIRGTSASGGDRG